MQGYWNRVNGYLRDGIFSKRLQGVIDVLVVTTEIPFKEQIALMQDCGFESDGDDILTLFGGTIDVANVQKLAQLPFIKDISENTATRQQNAFTLKPREIPDFSKLNIR